MRVLVLANATPWPPRGGAQLRILHLLERAAAHHEITLGCHMWSPADADGVAELNRRGLRTIGGLIRFTSTQRWIYEAIRHGLRGLPPETVKMQAAELHALVRAGEYDALQVEETILAPYFRSMPGDRPRHRVLTMHNVHFLQDARMARIEPSLRWKLARRFNGAWMRSYEPRIAARMDGVITMSEADSTALRSRAPHVRPTVIPNGVDTRRITPLPPSDGPPTLLFVGSMMYRPCVDAAIWLVREILPRLKQLHPSLSLYIVGRAPLPEVLALAGEDVTVTGEVDDLRPYYARATLAVAPIRAGGGTRLKILEAMAYGRAMVSTSLGAEGLNLADGTEIALADDVDTMVTAISTLLNNPARRGQLAAAARGRAEADYDWDRLSAMQLSLYDSLPAPRAPGMPAAYADSVR